MRSRHVLLTAVIAACTVAGPSLADGKRDLDDGIAFYENLDTERAIDRLRAAARAPDLAGADRARAFMYLGIVLFETGKERDAEVGWQSAFALNPKVVVPSGTSPKIVQVIERLRSSARPKADPQPDSSPDGPKLGQATPPPSPSPVPSMDPTPAIDAAPVDLTPPPPLAEDPDDDGGVPAWLIWGGVGAVVVGGALTAILLATSGPSCDNGACLLVDLQ